jgi:AcrR family transcriptional regulator
VLANPFAPSAFLTPTSVNTRDLLTDAVFEVLERSGITGMTTGSIARAMSVAPQAVLKRAGDRARLDRIVVGEFSRRWSRWCRSACYRTDLPVALPHDAVEVHAVTVWHALGELARGAALDGRPEPLAAMDEARRSERRHLRAVLAERLGDPPTDAELDGVVAVTNGVRAGMARTDEPLRLDEAQVVIAAYLRGVRLSRSADAG